MKRKNKELLVKEIPVDITKQHPKTGYEEIPYHEFTMGLVAPKGAGKTTLLCNLLNFYKGYFHTIIVFSPSVKNDEKWDWVKKQPLLAENKALQRWFKSRKKKQDECSIVDRPPVQDEMYDKYCNKRKNAEGKFDATIPDEWFIHDYDSETLASLINEQQELIDLLKDEGETKHLANRLLFIFDDLVGSALFSNKRNNPFKVLNTTHRHKSCSILMVTQGYKEIPKTVRTGYSCLVLFEICNEQEIAVIYEDFPMGLTKDKWLETYKYATKDPHSFLFYNMQRPKELRIMKNFNEILFVKDDEDNKV